MESKRYWSESNIIFYLKFRELGILSFYFSHKIVILAR